MQERQVTIAGETHRVPEPFVVMATQNPIETEGTYPLPEAQVDRFMMKVLVGYPTEEQEYVIVERVTGRAQAVAAVASTEELAQLQGECRRSTWIPR
jgi:MoxR-like ATPase